MKAFGIEKGSARRQILALLGSLALFLQVVAPLSPMPQARITTIRDLASALADLCTQGKPRQGVPSSPAGSRPTCQVCITIDMSGHFVAPAVVALAVPGRLGILDWHTQPLSAPVLVRAVGVQPRGPPILA
ncbi:MAG: hypothetical protein PHS60_05265 [Zavarzinia sp.]|nr:hypothetical protein [Zavarzinia sp.]